MTDAPQGPGWWQASDGRWYPPEQFTGADPSAPQPDAQAWSPDAVYQQGPAQVGYGYGYAPPKNETLAIVALVCGIVAFPMMCLCGIFSIPLSIAAVVCGLVGRKKIKESNGQLTGDGMALAGLILGCVAAALSIVGMIAWGALMLGTSST